MNVIFAVLLKPRAAPSSRSEQEGRRCSPRSNIAVVLPGERISMPGAARAISRQASLRIRRPDWKNVVTDDSRPTVNSRRASLRCAARSIPSRLAPNPTSKSRIATR